MSPIREFAKQNAKHILIRGAGAADYSRQVSPFVDFHRFAPLNTRDLLTPYPGKGLYRLRR
jgi:hypothetical protein